MTLKTLILIQKKFPSSWRPKCDGLIKCLSEILNQSDEKYADIVIFLIKCIKSHKDISIGSESLFHKIVQIFDLFMNYGYYLDRYFLYNFLSRALCSPFFFQKISGFVLGNTFNHFLDALCRFDKETSDIRRSVYEFIPFFF